MVLPLPFSTRYVIDDIKWHSEYISEPERFSFAHTPLNVRFPQNLMTEPLLRGYGHTATSDDSPLVTPDTVFLIASLSKVFAGAAVMFLILEGYINSLDDDICDVIPSDWDRSACRNPRYPSVPVTWRMLVTHRSSLRRDVPWLDNDNGLNAVGYGPIGGYFGEASGGPCPLDDNIGFYRDFLTDKSTETLVGSSQNVNWYELGEETGGAWLNFRPGTEVLYSNVATGYIAPLVELATGMPFPVFCENHIFGPLQMDSTAWFRRDLPAGVPEAMPVSFNEGTNQDVGHYCFVDYASGSVRTSVRDLSIFLDAMLSYGETIWPKEAGLESISCQARNASGGAPSIVSETKCDFGFLWILLNNDLRSLPLRSLEHSIKDYDWTNAGWHEGGEAGVRTHMVVLPEAGVYAAVLTNTDGNDSFADEYVFSEMVNTLRGVSSSPPTPAPIIPPTSPQPFEIEIRVLHDVDADETAWALEDAQGNILLRQDFGAVTEEFELVQETVRVPAGAYKFVIRDEYGDGICCQTASGLYTIAVCGRSIFFGGEFGYHDIAEFVIDESFASC